MIKRAFITLLLLFSASSCAGPLLQANYNVRESYRSPDFKDIYDGETVGLLTATDGESSLEYRKLLGEFIEEAIRKERPDIKVVPYWQSLSTINRVGYTAEYAEMLKAYASTGILDRARLKKLGDAIGARYFIQPRLINFRQNQSTRFSAFGLTLFKTHESEIKVYIELWDADTGTVVWIGVADTNMASEKLMARPIPFEEVAKYAIANLIKQMP